MFIHLLLFALIVPVWNYELKTCCSPEKTTRLLSCPLNFVLKLRSVIFHAGNGCASSSCQRRLNKHYLLCNARRTCSISIECLPMECLDEQLNVTGNQSEYLTVEYDCHLHPVGKVVLFSAQVNIESPPVEAEEEEEEQQWKDYLWKTYLRERESPSRPLFSDVFRTLFILLLFAGLLLVPMLVSLLIYKCVKSRERTNKHRPFPADDDAYDNLKNSSVESP